MSIFKSHVLLFLSFFFLNADDSFTLLSYNNSFPLVCKDAISKNVYVKIVKEDNDEHIFLNVYHVESPSSSSSFKGTLIGQAEFEIEDKEKKEWILEDIYVDTDYQGQGIGRGLIEVFETTFQPATIYLMSVPTAVGFYQKLGFTPGWDTQEALQDQQKNNDNFNTLVEAVRQKIATSTFESFMAEIKTNGESCDPLEQAEQQLFILAVIQIATALKNNDQTALEKCRQKYTSVGGLMYKNYPLPLIS